MRHIALSACLCLFALPALAAEGVIVWNDPGKMAIRMATFDSKDPSTIRSVKTLAELTAVSATMTAVSADGGGIGLCRQEQDQNEAPAWLLGYDRKGRQLWRHNADHYIKALASVLPRGLQPYHYNSPSWFTFECKDGGASGAAGVLAFDVGFSAGKPDAEGFVIADKSKAFIGRLHVSARTGEVLSVALVKKGKAAIALGPNPKSPVMTDPVTGETLAMGGDSGLVLPKGGRGRVMWGNSPLRWKGEPLVDGFDFAWHLPPRD